MQVFSIITLDYGAKVKKNYYPQTLLEECKYEPKKIKMQNLINEDLEKVHLMSLIMKLIMTLMMKRNLTMRKIMMNPMNNFLKLKKVFY